MATELDVLRLSPQRRRCFVAIMLCLRLQLLTNIGVRSDDGINSESASSSEVLPISTSCDTGGFVVAVSLLSHPLAPEKFVSFGSVVDNGVQTEESLDAVCDLVKVELNFSATNVAKIDFVLLKTS